MSYHDLSECTLDSAERAEEAQRLLTIIIEKDNISKLTDHELEFVTDVCMKDYSVSVKQLFWLRDIKERLLG